VAIFFIAGFIGYKWRQAEPAFGLANSEFQPFASDVVGTKSATSTTGVGFSITATGGRSATSSYVSRIGGVKNNAVYTIKPLAVSSTAALYVEIEGSNDDYCGTTNTDVSVNTPLVSDINWYSAGDHYVNKVHSTSFDNASSTSFTSWANPKVGVGKEIILTDLNYECLRFNISGSSTVAWVQIRTK
jgi:hypothetical protein